MTLRFEKIMRPHESELLRAFLCGETWPQLQRIEGTTRQDNWAMRHVFAACGYLKEGHFRQAWQGYDAIQYAILRQDWESGRSSPVNWDDQPRPIQSQSHRDKIHPRWWPLLEGLNTQAQDYFGSALKAVYLLGSLGRGQEIIGSSDLDLEWVIDHPLQRKRLGLGLAMCHQPVYTREVADMPRLVAQIFPDLTAPMELAYALAEARWPEKPAV